uniref:P-type domain-containing protein n=1 Tax=Sinocyclocheilus rhinocerous TaxID=307959 RepID=A0A673K9X0_9TELE
DMNEVANFVKGGINGCTDNKLNYPPFTPSESQMHLQLDYRKHALGKNRFNLIKFPYTPWSDFSESHDVILQIGADICGFFDNSTEELCTCWMQMGTFYPFSCNHKAQGYADQDPAAYGFDSLVVNTSRHYLNIRYTLLPYLYTLFYKAHVKGETVVHPDPFSICSSVSGKKLYVCVMKVVCSLSWRHPMGLIVALDDNKTASGELFWDDGDSRDTVASSDCIHYQFSVANGVLSMQVAHNGYQDPNNLKFENITVLGVTAAPALVAVSDGNTVISLSDSQIQYDIYKQVLHLKNLELELGKDYTVNWEAKISANIDCYPEGSEDQAKCEARGCICEPLSVPLCYYAENHGYITNRNTEFPSQRSRSQDISKLRVEITYLSGRSLLSIFDPENARYEVPVPLDLPAAPETVEGKRDYRVQINDRPFGIQEIRKGTEEVIWDSAVPGLTFSDQFLQISTRLLLEYVYGFGETEHPTYKHSLDFHKYGLFAKDQPPGVSVRTNGDVLQAFLNDSPMIGHLVLPAYWSLGFQLCRYVYSNDTEIADLYRDMKAAQIPYDVQYADIDYMERQMDFTLDQVNFKGLPALVDQMRAEGMRFIFILTKGSYPAFDTGIEKDVFIKWPPEFSNDIVLGKVWPDYPNITVDNSLDWDTQVELFRAFAAFPDFFKTSTAEWWREQIKDIYNNIMMFDGLWIDLNEPASFVHGTVGENCLGNKDSENPPYMPRKFLKHKTLCMNSEQILANGTCVKHYDVHNLYGWAHTKPTYDALLSTTGKRGVVVTRSTYPSSGCWAAHWLGDNYSAWDQLLKSIIGMCLFISGKISITGADICGFFNVAEYEMCLRWMQLGAFYPLSRNHNTINMPRQGPVAWGPEFAAVSRDVLNIRYTLLPYLYTLMYEAHGVTVVKGYLSYGVWYDYHTVRGEFVDMDTPLEKINLHVRVGHILPWQKPENNTHYSRQNALGLIVALNDGGEAKGSLFWDDGEGIGEFCVVVCL